MIPRSATELSMFSHRLGIEYNSDGYKEFVAQRTELRMKAKELWAQCDEESRKRVEDAANSKARSAWGIKSVAAPVPAAATSAGLHT